MWIELPDDIEIYLKNIKCSMSRSALAINNLFDSMLKGQHIIFASRVLLKKILDFQYLNPSNKSFIIWIEQHYVSLYECRDVIEYKIIVDTKADTIFVQSNTFIVPLDYFYDFRETKLLTENETDGEFFLGIYKYIRKHKKFSKTFDIKFENDSCHGANVSSKIAQNASDQRIALCILDSDREMKGAKLGPTYKGANKVYNKIKNDHIMILKALNVREKENLFSPNFYLLICDAKQQLLNVLDQFTNDEKIIKYFDIKDGIKYKKYLINGWEDYYKNVIDKLDEVGIYKLPNEEEKNNPDFICLEGIGEKVCDVLGKVLLQDGEVTDETLKKYSISKEKKNVIKKVRDDLWNQLPQYLYVEWEDIYNIMFSWGCCIASKSLPNHYI